MLNNAPYALQIIVTLEFTALLNAKKGHVEVTTLRTIIQKDTGYHKIKV